jgi:TolB-like protein/Flp pilus assembly protein TadD
MLRRIVQLQTSIVVLPFSALSSNLDDKSLGLGLAEDLIIALTKVDGLRVVDKISALSFRGKSRDLRSVAHELGASTVLDGTVQRSGSKLRIAVRLFDSVDESYLWAEQFDRKAEDVFEIQDEIVRSVVQRLKTSLVAETALPNVRRSPVCISAYENYSRGRYYLHKLTEERLGKAISHFKQTIQEDPKFAAAYAGLSDCHCGLPYFGNVSPREAFSQAETYAHKALDLDPASAEAHLAMATVHMLGRWDWNSARREFEHTIDLRPSFSNAFYWWAHYLAAMGRKRDAIAAARHAQELEPLSLVANAFLGFALYSAHQFEEAEEVCRKAIDLQPEFFEPHWILGKALLKMWRYEEAIAEFEKARCLSANSPVSNAELATTQAVLGKRSDAEAMFDALQERSSSEYVPPTCFASISTALGRHDEAFKWLEQGYEKRCCYLIYLKAEPGFEPLSADPRFADLLQRIGLPS